MKALISIVFITSMLSTLNCVAQTAAAPAPTPCEGDARFAEFDFWIGDWEVHTADGTYAGSNTISKAERGCVLLEQWRGASGSTGMSIN